MAEPESRYDGMKALVVDDDSAVRILIRRMLERLGFDVDVAGDGEAALDLTRTRSFDVVFTDLAMPGMSGLDFLREVRDRGLRAPVILLTATSSVPKAVEAMKSGAFDFLEKPLRADSLARIVGAAVRTGDESRRSEILDGDIVDRTGQPSMTRDVGVPGEAPREPSLSLDIDVEEAAPPRSAPEAMVGETRRIGRYELVNRIGRGGMGVVFRCRDPLLGRMVAVKVLHAFAEAPEHQAEMRSRFRREAAAAGTLQHPDIVAVHDLGFDEARGDWYIVMELLEGRGLHLHLTEKRRLSVVETVRLGFHMSDALAYAHSKGVIHRDIKPSNVHVQPGGDAKLLDFGLAAVEGWDVTMSGRVFGSPSYMAPERIRGGQGGPPGDQFSLGTVLYECIAGRNPFDAEAPEGRLRNVLDLHPRPLCVVDEDVPVPLSDTIARMMAKEVSQRFPSMDEVAAEFRSMGRVLGLDLKRHAAVR